MRTKQDVSFCWRDLEPYPCWFMIWVCVMFPLKNCGYHPIWRQRGTAKAFDGLIHQKSVLPRCRGQGGQDYAKFRRCQREPTWFNLTNLTYPVGGLEHDLFSMYIRVYIYIYTYWECHNPNWLSLIFFGVGWNHQADIYTSQRRYNEGLTSKLLSTILGHLWIRVW